MRCIFLCSKLHDPVDGLSPYLHHGPLEHYDQSPRSNTNKEYQSGLLFI